MEDIDSKYSYLFHIYIISYYIILYLDGIITVNVAGSALARVFGGIEVTIGLECIQIVNTFALPNQIVGGNCTYKYH